MTIVPAASLSRTEIRMLGTNVVAAVRNDRLKRVVVHDEAIEAPTIPVARDMSQGHQAVA